MANINDGNDTAGVANVDATFNLQTTLPGYGSDGVAHGGGPANGPAIFSENDPGAKTGARDTSSPETDEDWRLRMALDHVLDRETFNYAAQNTGKHAHAFTTLTATASTNGLLLNSGSGVATATGMTFGTFAEFPCGMGAASTYCETTMALSQSTDSIPANVQVDVGMFRRGASTAFAPTDGVYFRFSSAGVLGIINNSTTETQVVLPAPGFLALENHKYGLSITEKVVKFWIDNILYGELTAPTANGQLFRSATLPWSVRHANTGAVAGVLQTIVTDYTISHGGPSYTSAFSAVGNRSLGSYQGLSGGTMGSLALYANAAIPTSAAGSNTATNITGLGGRGAINAAAGAAAADYLMCSYQVPAGTIAVQGRRLVINGVWISCANLGAAVATTATTLGFSLNFGNTAVSLAQAETASFAVNTTKAPRRIPLGLMFWNVGAVVGAGPQNGDIYRQFANPIYVNPGEWVSTAMQFLVGTATASQSIWYHVGFDYGWE